MDPVPDTLPLRKSSSAGNRTPASDLWRGIMTTRPQTRSYGDNIVAEMW
jgi:hypothetical protein